MTPKPIRIVRCPTCTKSCRYDETNPTRPFCSERCRLADTAAWANEDYKVPGKKLEDVTSDTDTEVPDDEDDQ